MAPKRPPHLPVFKPLHISHLCVFPFPGTWTGLVDSILMKRVWQKGWDVTSEIRLQKDCGFCSGVLPLTHSCSFSLVLVSDIGGSQLPCCEAALWRGPYFERSKLSNYMWVKMEVDHSPIKPLDETGSREQPYEKPLGRNTPLCHTWIPDQRSCDIVYFCCFKLLSFGVIWKTAIDN